MSFYKVIPPLQATNTQANQRIDDNIQVSHKDLEALNLTSVYLKDGSGEIASLGVYHALHCLVYIPVQEDIHQG